MRRRNVNVVTKPRQKRPPKNNVKNESQRVRVINAPCHVPKWNNGPELLQDPHQDPSINPLRKVSSHADTAPNILFWQSKPGKEGGSSRTIDSRSDSSRWITEYTVLARSPVLASDSSSPLPLDPGETSCQKEPRAGPGSPNSTVGPTE
ncbi:hypothetical protein KM043_005872 [Ampulex compressa]|nr:hypothetical protein KM043_005872 [Ampulex compressa]